MSVAPIGPIAAALRVQILGAARVVAVIIGFIMRAAGTLPPEQALTSRADPPGPAGAAPRAG